jgi:DEAD/DEAH box helicase domain-containing protein
LISKHFIFDGSINASGLRTIPFGIEYCKSVDVIDVNLGDSEQRDARDLQINEREHVPVKGFVTCRYCGKSTSKSHDLNVTDPKELHYSFCKHKDQAYKDKPDEFFEEVYLYHKFHTEAIKVLLPVQEVDTEATTDMFAAGIGLGLRDYFEGNPDHIKIEKYKTYNDKTHRFDRYIILYDTIPGGTGYLAQICNPTEFEKILQNAWERIHTCKCKEEGKDGCYHCIFTYSNQRIQDKLSRKRADELFRKILDNCYDEKNGTSNWEQIGKLGILSQDGGMEESELEKRFIYAIQNYVQQDNQADGTHSWSFEKDDLSYRQQYKLSYDDGLNFIRPVRLKNDC